MATFSPSLLARRRRRLSFLWWSFGPFEAYGSCGRFHSILWGMWQMRPTGKPGYVRRRWGTMLWAKLHSVGAFCTWLPVCIFEVGKCKWSETCVTTRYCLPKLVSKESSKSWTMVRGRICQLLVIWFQFQIFKIYLCDNGVQLSPVSSDMPYSSCIAKPILGFMEPGQYETPSVLSQVPQDNTSLRGVLQVCQWPASDTHKSDTLTCKGYALNW